MMCTVTVPESIKPPLSFTYALKEYVAWVSKSRGASTDSTPEVAFRVNAV